MREFSNSDAAVDVRLKVASLHRPCSSLVDGPCQVRARHRGQVFRMVALRNASATNERHWIYVVVKGWTTDPTYLETLRMLAQTSQSIGCLAYGPVGLYILVDGDMDGDLVVATWLSLDLKEVDVLHKQHGARAGNVANRVVNIARLAHMSFQEAMRFRWETKGKQIFKKWNSAKFSFIQDGVYTATKAITMPP